MRAKVVPGCPLYCASGAGFPLPQSEGMQPDRVSQGLPVDVGGKGTGRKLFARIAVR